TPMGARLLRDWLSQPLADAAAIRRRQGAVGAWLAAMDVLLPFREALREVRDLERTLGRLAAGSGSPRDLASLRAALEQIPRLRDAATEAGSRRGAGIDPLLGSEGTGDAGQEPGLLVELASQLEPERELADEIARAIVDDPPAGLKEGGLIRDGYDGELDELRRAQREGQDWIARLQQQEIERTGIASLKIRFNSVFGYFIE